jgi:hypothetical protein
LLWGLLGFVALQFGLAAGIETRFKALRDPDYSYKADRLRKRTIAPDRPLTVVMIGSSRTVFGFQSSTLETSLTQMCGRPVAVFNFGFAGSGPVGQLLRLRRLLADGVRPDWLFIEVLPPLLGQRVEANRISVDQLRQTELEFLSQYGASLPDLQSSWWEDWPIPWYSHRFAIVSRLKPSLLPFSLRRDWFSAIDDSGWVAAPVLSSTPEQYAKAVERARVEYDYYLRDFHLGQPACQALRDLLELCRQEGIRPALVLMPEGSTFRGWYTPAVWAEIEGFLKELQGAYEVPLINAREWIPDEEFSDSHHLTQMGAATFTERFGREVLVPLLTP